MAMEQYFQDSVTQTELTDDKPSIQKWKSVPDAVDGSENNLTGGFDCNICLDTVQDPVVTLCGHLYCWPCIYKWIHYQSVSADNLEKLQPQCPVCKAEVSEQSIVPLYGRGQTTDASESKGAHFGIVIPQRPASPRCGFHTLITTTATTDSRPAPQLHQLHNRRGYPQQPHPYFAQPGSYPGNPMVRLGGTTVTNAVNPMVGMIGEMVYSRIFGNSETTLYSYPNSYNIAGSSSPRVRRHLMEADKSLNRICFFLFCCLVLCFLLF